MSSYQSNAEAPSASHKSSRATTLLMSAASGLAVANLYYSQPLLTQMGADFGAPAAAGYIPMYTQIGTMFGMGLFVPLGDMFERRKLIVLMCVAIAGMLVLSAASPTMSLLAVASVCLGLTCIVPHLILPFAAQIAAPEERGRVVGTVLSGLLIGILCARTFSGFVGASFGWRTVYVSSAAMMVFLAFTLRSALPQSHPTADYTYGQLLRSLGTLVKRYGELREAAFIGAMLFGAFSAFWSTLVFRLSTPPFHYGSRAAGLFGLIGAVGAAAAPLVGKIADRHGPRKTVEISLLVCAAAYLVFWALGWSIAGLVAGVVFMDLGVQAGHVSNQARIYSLLPEARSRANTIYMVTYFLGGAAGSALGAFAWHRVGWAGVCLVGFAFSVVALLVHYFAGSKAAIPVSQAET